MEQRGDQMEFLRVSEDGEGEAVPRRAKDSVGAAAKGSLRMTRLYLKE